jgi:hypothetical protein
MKIERLSLLVVLAAAALWGPACVDPYLTDRVTGVERCGSYVFALRSDKPLQELDVLEVSDTGRIADVLWRITANEPALHGRPICYGVVPRGFKQLIPRSAPPERLGPRHYRVRTRSYALGDAALHFYEGGAAGETRWRERERAGRSVPFAEADYGFRIDEAGRVVTPRSGL